MQDNYVYKQEIVLNINDSFDTYDYRDACNYYLQSVITKYSTSVDPAIYIGEIN